MEYTSFTDKPLYERYNLNADEYADVFLTTLPFSVRSINRFNENGITTVADLLKKTITYLMSLKGFGKGCLDEVEAFCAKLNEDNSVSVAYDKTVLSGVLSLFINNRDEVAVGDFSVFDNMELSESEEAMLQRYKEAYDILGEELVFECVASFENVEPIIRMFEDYQSITKKYIEILEIVNALPENRKRNRAFGYINAFTLDEKERSLLKSMCDSEETTLLSMASTDKVDDASAYILLKKFFKWCAFDLEKEISHLFENIYSNERIRTVIQLRVKKQTLEQVGGVLGVTRERVRQIELKARKKFSYSYSRIRIISKIVAEQNGEIIVTPTNIRKYCGEHTSELLFFLRLYESAHYTYDQLLDIFILGDDSIASRVQSTIESLPEIIKISNLDSLLCKAAEEADIPIEVLEKTFLDAYRIKGDVYHRCRLSLATIYERVLNTYYPQGFRAYDTDELRRFREIIADEYGDVGVSANDHALTSRVASICILCGKGVYRAKKKEGYISRQLANKICEYIENSENTIFLTNTIFSVFEEELLAAGVDNKYFLQGVLRELFADKFVFTRDYISKDVDVTSLYSEVVEFIRKSDFPVSKAQIQKAFPGITEIVIAVSASDPNVLNYFGEYLHASKLNILDNEKAYLFNVIDELISDGKVHHGQEIYEIISCQKPEILTRNAAMQQFSAFSVCEHLFRDKFQFSRPCVAKTGIEISRMTERLHNLIYSGDQFTVGEISEFCKENRFQINSLLEYVNGCNDEFLLVNNDTMMRISQTGIDEAVAHQVENIIFESISETTPVKNLTVWAELPSIKVPWTEWLIYSVITKWGTKLCASTSANQFRLSLPLVAPVDNFDSSAFKNIDKNDTSATFVADDLSNMDSLLEEIIGDDFLDGF